MTQHPTSRSLEFRAKVAGAALESKIIADLAKEYRVPKAQIYRWRKAFIETSQNSLWIGRRKNNHDEEIAE